jgi:hypothetical protein
MEPSMDIDVMDGYRPNRWAKSNQLSRVSHGYKQFNTPKTVNFRGEQAYDDIVIQEIASRGKKMGVNQIIPIVKPLQILSTRKVIQPALNEQGKLNEKIMSQQKLGNFVDLYV